MKPAGTSDERHYVGKPTDPVRIPGLPIKRIPIERPNLPLSTHGGSVQIGTPAGVLDDQGATSR